MAYIGNSPANVGNYQQVDDISGSFNGTLVTFNLLVASAAISPAKDGQLLVSVNGVMQEPDSTGTNGFKVSGSTIVFSSAPASSSTFWAIYQGQNVDVGTPSAGTVGTTELSATGVSATKFLRGDNTWVVPTDTNTTYTVGDGGLTTNDFTNADHTKLNGIATSANNYSHPTGAGDKHIPTAGATDQYLKYSSSGTAVWADVSGGATGAGGDKVFMENELIVTTNYTLSTNKSALSVGPVTINTGISVTVPTGHTWVVL